MPPPINNKYGPQIRENCFKLYCNGMSISQISKESGVSPATLGQWRKEFGWEERKQQFMLLAPINVQQEIALRKEKGKEKGISDEDLDSLENIKLVEETCMAMLKGEIPHWIHEKNRKRAYIPENFKEATDALQKCWQAKERIVARITPKAKKEGPTFEGDVTFNIIELVKEATQALPPVDAGGND